MGPALVDWPKGWFRGVTIINPVAFGANDETALIAFAVAFGAPLACRAIAQLWLCEDSDYRTRTVKNAPISRVGLYYNMYNAIYLLGRSTCRRGCSHFRGWFFKYLGVAFCGIVCVLVGYVLGALLSGSRDSYLD